MQNKLDCNNTWFVKPGKIKQGSRCPFCNDGISFNNKVLRILFDILKPNDYKIEFNIPEVENKYRYDGYFILNKGKTQEKILIELDGRQHKEETGINCSWVKLEKQKEIDRKKDELAKKYNYHLIRIDCSNSHKQNIRAIKESELKYLLNFVNIDWKEVQKRAEKSIVMELCDFIKTNPEKTLKECCQIFNLSKSGIEQYIKIGKDLKILPNNFQIKTEHKNFYNPNTNVYFRGKPIMVFEKDTSKFPVYIFLTSNRCVKFLQEIGKGYIDLKIVRQVILGKHPPYKGYIFTYATQEDLNKYKDLIII